MKECYEATWREHLRDELRCNKESEEDIVMTRMAKFHERLMDEQSRYADEIQFTVWTKKHVYYPVVSDGGCCNGSFYSVMSVERNPPEEA